MLLAMPFSFENGKYGFKLSCLGFKKCGDCKNIENEI